MIRKKIGRKIFVEKNPKTFGRKKFWDQKFSIFCRKKIIEHFGEKKSDQKYFRPTKNFDHFLFDKSFRIFFRRKMIDHYFFGSPISIPNDPKIPKITLRTACDHYKNTNNAHEIKIPLFSCYFPSDPVLGGRGS